MKKIVTVIILVAALQLLLVSASYAAPPEWGGGGSHHQVMYGETLYSIGRMYNVHPNCIAEANGLWNPDVIYAGSVLYVPANCHPYPSWGHYPVKYPNNCWNGCYSGCQTVNCKVTVKCNTCGYQQPVAVPYHNYGYDYTGYYYGHGKDRYSHSCGYYNNCW
jgi:hypothetical protein